MKVTSRDRGLAGMLRRLDGARRPRVVTVGVHEEQGAAPTEDGKATVIQVAEINEFGLGVPARSFVGSWADAKRPASEKELAALARALKSGAVETPEQGLAQLGELYVGEIQARISAGIAPENAPSTIAKKGSSKPLEDKGQLRSSITAEVE